MDEELEEFRAIFLDECLENIELLESGLMRMGEGDSDLDTVNEVFRAAHSIKGGASTFGFNPMAELTHHMETLLDEMRAERRPVVEEDVDLLLNALDLLQTILTAGGDDDSDHPDRASVQVKLEKSVANTGDISNDSDAAATKDVNTEVIDDAPTAISKLLIQFLPKPEFYKRGNDPLLLIREIARISSVESLRVSSRCSDWAAFDPSESFLEWVIQVSNVEKADILEIFEWVDTDCDLSVEEIPTEALPIDKAQAPLNVEVSGLEADKSKDVNAKDANTKESTPVTAQPTQNDSSKAAKKPAKPNQETSSIRIATDKIDHLINLVGELVITQSMLSRVSDSIDDIDRDSLRERVTDLEHNTRDLQESVMQVRMLPISSAFSRLPRLVRDLSKKLDKKVDLQLEGETTELDKTVLERMIDPLVHLVRNGLDHGLETTEERIAAGKSEVGILKLSARQASGSVVIEIKDDGKGINPERILTLARERGIVGEDEELSLEQINQLIFAPGFSTAEEVSDVSGRGVGMDVVRRNIVDLGGRVTVHSELGKGTLIEIKLPLSLAILDGQLVSVAGETYVIPILSIIETLELTKTEHSTVPERGEICQFRGEYLSMIRMASYFNHSGEKSENLVVVVDTHGKRVGLVVDQVIGQQQVVIKPLDKNYKNVSGLAGATIMSDGSVALIMDPTSIYESSYVAEAA